MKTETFDKMKTHKLYQFSAVPFINNLLLSGVPLANIDTNDWNSSYMPRVYVTKGIKRAKAHVKQFGPNTLKRLVNFYNS